MVHPDRGLLAVGFAIFLARDVLSRDTGTKAMMDVSATIQEGAVAFIKRQYSTIFLLALVGSVIITQSSRSSRPRTSPTPAHTVWRWAFGQAAHSWSRRLLDGLRDHRHAGQRQGQRARRLRRSPESRRSGPGGHARWRVSGFLVVSLSLLGVWSIFAVNGGLAGGQSTHDAPFLIVGYGFGASSWPSSPS